MVENVGLGWVFWDIVSCARAQTFTWELTIFPRTMNKLERYLGVMYKDIYQTEIMTETPSTFPEPDTPTIMT